MPSNRKYMRANVLIFGLSLVQKINWFRQEIFPLSSFSRTSKMVP